MLIWVLWNSFGHPRISSGFSCIFSEFNRILLYFIEFSPIIFGFSRILLLSSEFSWILAASLKITCILLDCSDIFSYSLEFVRILPHSLGSYVNLVEFSKFFSYSSGFCGNISNYLGFSRILSNSSRFSRILSEYFGFSRILFHCSKLVEIIRIFSYSLEFFRILPSFLKLSQTVTNSNEFSWILLNSPGVPLILSDSFEFIQIFWNFLKTWSNSLVCFHILSDSLGVSISFGFFQIFSKIGRVLSSSPGFFRIL